MAANTAALRAVGRRLAASSGPASAPASAPRALTARHRQLWQAPILRPFSHSAPTTKNSIGPLPTFTPTSSADLDHLLQHLRTEMFIPPHLLERQRLLIHRKKHHSLLEEEPIFIPIGTQTVQLTPKLVHHHLPRKLFVKAVQMMRSPSDFDAIPGLVMGYAQGGLPLYEKNINMAVRSAGLGGRADIILRILEQAEFNKIRITAATAREAFRGFIVRAGLPEKKAVVKAVREVRRLRNLLALQDNLVLGEYTSASATLSHAGKTQLGIEAALGPAPVKVATDPICLGTLAGITAGASMRFNNGLDHKGYTSHYIQKLFDPSSWSRIQSLLATPIAPLPEKNEEGRRELFHWRREIIRDIGVFIDSLKSAEHVLSHTASYILNNMTPGSYLLNNTATQGEIEPSLWNPRLGIVELNGKEHAAELARLGKRLRLEIPLVEQVVGRWIEVMAGDGGKVMMWSEEDTRMRLDGTRLKYKWAAEQLVRRGVGSGEEVLEEVYEEGGEDGEGEGRR